MVGAGRGVGNGGIGVTVGINVAVGGIRVVVGTDVRVGVVGVHALIADISKTTIKIRVFTFLLCWKFNC